MARDVPDFAAMPIDDLPAEWTLDLRLPVGDCAQLKLREPTAGEHRDAQASAHRNTFLVATVSGLAAEVVGQLSARDFGDAKVYLHAFSREGRPNAWAEVEPDDLPPTFALTLRTPVGHKGVEPHTSLGLKEPSVADLDASAEVDVAQAGILMISRVSGVETRLIERLAIRDYDKASDYLLSFMRSGRKTGASG